MKKGSKNIRAPGNWERNTRYGIYMVPSLPDVIVAGTWRGERLFRFQRVALRG